MQTLSYHITPSTLGGSLRIPPSKSQTLRAILFASLAQGTSTVSHYLDSPDTHAMMVACRELGATITQTPNQLQITGTSGKLKIPENIIDAGNSGIVLRFITALLATLPAHSVITGDHSIRYNRVLSPLLKALTQLGAQCISLKQDGRAPVIIKGAISSGMAQLQGEDSQCVSALLIAASVLSGTTKIMVDNPGETPWVNLTCDWLTRLQVNFTNHHFQEYHIQGGTLFQAFHYTVPGDWSSALFPIITALITKTQVTLQGLDKEDPQGDKDVLEILSAMDAIMEYDNIAKTLTVFPSTLKGGTFSVNHIIDAVPALAVLGCFANSPLTLTQAGIARQKESDRLSAITVELRKMGANIKEEHDTLIISPSQLQGAVLNTHQDHRIVMALAVAALAAQGKSEIQDIAWVNKTYLDFHLAMQQVKAQITLEAIT